MTKDHIYSAATPLLFPRALLSYGPFLFCGNACVPAHNFQMSCGALSRGHLSYLQARYYRGLLSRGSVNLFKVKDCIAESLDSSANLFLALELIKGEKAQVGALLRSPCLLRERNARGPRLSKMDLAGKPC